MFARSPRRAIACLAALGVVGLTWLPAEHAHSRTDGDRHVEYVHRHFEVHHSAAAAALHIEHEDDDAQYLRVAFAPEPECRVHPDGGLVLVGPWRSYVSAVVDCDVSASFVSVHDPPWTNSLALRGPPPSAVLA